MQHDDQRKANTVEIAMICFPGELYSRLVVILFVVFTECLTTCNTQQTHTCSMGGYTELLLLAAPGGSWRTPNRPAPGFVWEWCTSATKVLILRGSGACGCRHSHAESAVFRHMCTTPTQNQQFVPRRLFLGCDFPGRV